MVCVPCFIVPVLLYLWHKFVQPILLKYWNPWEKKDKDGKVLPADTTKFPFDCTGGVCRFARKDAVTNRETESDQPPATSRTGADEEHDETTKKSL